MGQRLNLEIWSDGKCLANAYYHWSAYTSCASVLVNEVIQAYRSNPVAPTKLVAVRLLEATGAGLPYEEKAAMQAEYPDASFAECFGRNNGLIAVTNQAINETRYWEEYRATIHLDRQSVEFFVLRQIPVAEWRKYVEDDELNEELLDVNSLPQMQYDASKIPFDDFQAFSGMFDQNDVFYCHKTNTVIDSIE